jgi:hypothetical protein
MSNRKKDLYNIQSAQKTLFDAKITEGLLDVSMVFRDCLSKIMRQHNDSRWQVAAKISELSNHSISKDILDKYTSSNQDYGLRAEDLPAFCAATGSIEPVKILMAPIGVEVITSEEGEFVKIARLERTRSDLDAEIARLKMKNGMR